MTDQGASVSSRVPAFEKQLKLVKDGFKASIDKHKALGKAQTGTLINNLTKAQKREPFAGLETALGAVRDALQNIERARESAITERMKSTILDKIKDMDTNIKVPIKDLLDDMNKKLSTLKRQENKASPDETAIADARKNHRDATAQFFNNVPGFEESRVADTKVLLTEYCNSMMFYHCRAVEQLSAALAVIGQVESKKAEALAEKAVKRERDLGRR